MINIIVYRGRLVLEDNYLISENGKDWEPVQDLKYEMIPYNPSDLGEFTVKFKQLPDIAHLIAACSKGKLPRHYELALGKQRGVDCRFFFSYSRDENDGTYFLTGITTKQFYKFMFKFLRIQPCTFQLIEKA